MSRLLVEPNRVEIRRGGGLAVVLGLPLLLGGIAAATLRAWFELPEGVPTTLIGAVVAFVGFALTFFRIVITVDRSRNLAARRWSLLILLHKTEQALDRFEQVRFTKEIRNLGNSSIAVYKVFLQGGDEIFACTEESNRAKARRVAEALSKITERELSDETVQPPVLYAPGQLDENLRDRLRRIGERVMRPAELPEGSTLKMEESFEGVRIRLPRSGALGRFLGSGAGLIFGFIAFISAFLPLLRELLQELPSDFSEEELELILVIGGSFLALLFGLIVLALLGRSSLVASSMRVRLERKVGFWTLTKELMSDRIEEIEIVQSARAPTGLDKLVLQIRSDNKTFEVGEGMSVEELHWMRDMVRFYVTA